MNLDKSRCIILSRDGVTSYHLVYHQNSCSIPKILKTYSCQLKAELEICVAVEILGVAIPYFEFWTLGGCSSTVTTRSNKLFELHQNNSKCASEEMRPSLFCWGVSVQGIHLTDTLWSLKELFIIVPMVPFEKPLISAKPRVINWRSFFIEWHPISTFS